MVEAIKQYKDGISGRIYDSELDALESEYKNKDIKDTFESFYGKLHSNDNNFVNGAYCIQRDEPFYNRVLDSIISMVHEHEHWITNTPLIRDNIKGQSYVGRCLSESNSQLYKWFNVQTCICPVCYREYGQLYYALNCEHNDSIPTLE